MPVRKIITLPGSEMVLRTKSEPADLSSPQLKLLIQDLKDTLMATPGAVGLAAVQISALKRVFVLRKSYLAADLDKDSIFQKSGEVMVFINPKIISRKGTVEEDEGCLSIPGRFICLKRAKIVKVRAYDENGKQFYESFRGLASRAVQQEMDHLDGLLILDHAPEPGS